jgi:hypothetical protein
MLRALSRRLFPPLPEAGPVRSRSSAPPPPVPAALERFLAALPGYQPLTRRQRWMVVPALALATSLGLFYMMLERPGAKPAPASWFLPNPGTPNAEAAAAAAAAALQPAAPAGPVRCEPGQARGCVGGPAQVIVVTPPRAP